ncbi:MAG TPA: hypothetical protein VGO40_24585 [Longimicrobium sp.]|jgi:hypothetical protein|nr:hypothetical protein [Longimicrobium sp.]
MTMPVAFASIVLLLSRAPAADASPADRLHASQADSAYTPGRGSAERKAILDATRAHRRRFDPQPVIFVVTHLRVQRGWAWLSVRPQSPDGRSRFEDENALLRRRGGRWEVVETMPAAGEREGTELAEDCAWFQRLRRRVPAAPVAILPAEGRRACPIPRAR